MKVLFIGTDRNLFKSGSKVLERSLLYAAKMEEMHVLVFTLKSEKHKSRKIDNLYMYSTNSLSKWLYVADAYRLGKKIMKKAGFHTGSSVISAQDPFQTGFVGLCLSRRFKIPLQLQVHTDFLSSHFSSSSLNSVRKVIAHFVMPKAQGIRVVSDTIKESMKKHLNVCQIVPEVLPILVDVDRIAGTEVTQDLKKDFSYFKIVILMASRLTKEKKIQDGLLAIKQVVEQHPGVGLIIAGAGPEKNNLENRIKELGLTPRVRFLGWQEDLTSLYKSADIFLLTSSYEGYGMTLVEAGAAGCPIITTKVGVAKTDLFKNGVNSFVCPVGDVACLSKAISDLITDSSKRELFKAQMQDSIKTIAISRDEYVDRYVGLLEKLTAKA